MKFGHEGRFPDKAYREFSIDVASALAGAGASASISNDDALHADSLLLAMLSQDGPFWESVFQGQPISFDRFRTFLKKAIDTRRLQTTSGHVQALEPSPEFQKTFQAAFIEGLTGRRTPKLSLGTLLIAMLAEAKEEVVATLMLANVDIELLFENIYKQQRDADRAFF